LLLLGSACDDSGDYESECTLTCTLPDGGVVQNQQTVACCGVHDSPSHPHEEGSACTVNWVLTHSQQLCAMQTVYFSDADAGDVAYLCPASAFQCSCGGPHTYPSWQGCD
jgi:hypothetical protein